MYPLLRVVIRYQIENMALGTFNIPIGCQCTVQALDCIISVESLSICFGVIARPGRRYAGLEALHRRADGKGVILVQEEPRYPMLINY